MRFVDSKGRLFGVINLIDLLVVIVALTLIGTVIVNFAIRANTKKTNLEVMVKALYRVPNEVARNDKILKRGDPVLVGNAFIEKVLEIRPVVSDTGKETAYSDIVILIKANCVLLNSEYFCANMPIKVNSPITIANPKYVLSSGVILDIEPTQAAEIK